MLDFMTHFFEQIAATSQSAQPAVLGIITRVKGSSPQKPGAKALFFPDGRIIGTLGGGCLEAEIQKRAIASLQTQKAEAFDLLLDHDFGWDDGLICGGKVFGLILPQALQEISLWKKLAQRQEPIRWGIDENFNVIENPSKDQALYEETSYPPVHLWIAGAGHIAKALAPLAASLDFTVTVLDDRPALASYENFPKEVQLKTDYWDNLLTIHPPDHQKTFGVIVTRGHKHDALVLRHWIQYPFSFLGMIGSKRKVQMIRDHFLQEKLATEAQFNRVQCPVGINIEAQSPQEIAVSIAGQLIQSRASLNF
jgi:xanthine dehydrogenase accessory factor